MNHSGGSSLNLSMRVLVVWCQVLMFSWFFPAGTRAAKKGWTERYTPRAVEDIDSHKLLELYGGDMRKVMSLNGQWQARLVDEEDFHNVWVPGAFDFEGRVRFKRSFELDSSFVDKQLKLVLLGVNNRCKIYLNRQFLSSHVSGNTAFSVDLDEDKLVLPGTNELVIEVDNTLLPRESIPLRHHPGIAHNYGGVIRDILIQVLPPVAIKSVRVNYLFSDGFGKCELTLQTLLHRRDDFLLAEGTSLTLQAELWDSTGTRLIAKSSPKPVKFDRVVSQDTLKLKVDGVELWTPDQPHLYEVRAILKEGRTTLDVSSFEVGFSVAEVAEGKYLLNGQPFPLRGVNWYADASVAGPVVNPEICEETVRKIKSLGANAVRVVGTPPHPYLFDVCDRLGLLVFTEMPLSFVPAVRLGNAAFTEMVSDYFTEILLQSVPHVSLGGVGFGTDVQFDLLAGDLFLQVLRAAAGEAARPFYASYRHYMPSRWPDEIDLVFIDLYQHNAEQVEAERQKWEKLTQQLGYVYMVGFPFTQTHERDPDSRNPGLDGNADVYQPGLQDVAVQAYELNRVLTKISTDKEKAGVFIHTLADWREALPNIIFGVPEGEYVHASGLLGWDRKERLAFDIVESLFKEGQTKKMSLRLPPSQKPNEYPVFGILLILMFLFNFNRSRRFRSNLKRIFLYPHGFYMDLRDNRKISKGQTLLLSLVATVVVSIILSSVAFNFRENLLFNDLLNLMVDSPALKSKLIWLAWHPLACIVFLVVLHYTLYSYAIVLLRVTALILGKRLPLVQYATLVFWAAACYVWLLPLVPIFYRLINQTEWGAIAAAVIGLVSGWFFVRLFRGVKVIFGLSILRAGTFVLVLGMLIIGSLAWYLDKKYAVVDYLPMYWTVLSDKISL